MWTVVYVAPNRPVADMLKEMLENDGLLVMVRCAGIPHLGNSAQFEILVPESEVDEAQIALSRVLGR
ncbi:MAG: glutamate decarboxylase [Firmicutes bacterium]|jgi:hypothetical protein|nr:glutamate decarboxylase [Bacillota bacterium]